MKIFFSDYPYGHHSDIYQIRNLYICIFIFSQIFQHKFDVNVCKWKKKSSDIVYGRLLSCNFCSHLADLHFLILGEKTYKQIEYDAANFNWLLLHAKRLPWWLKGIEFTCHARVWFQTLIWFLVQEKEMTTHSNILVRKTPWTEKPGGLQSADGRELDTP